LTHAQHLFPDLKLISALAEVATAFVSPGLTGSLAKERAAA